MVFESSGILVETMAAIGCPLWGLRIQAPFGAVGIGTGAVFFSIPEG